MIRVEAGMSTTRFCELIDMPGTWRRWQAKARAGQRPKGRWPRPAREAAAELIDKHALDHPVWGHRKIWAMVRHDGHVVSEATVLRRCDRGLILRDQYQRERRKLAERGKAAFAKEPIGPDQVWQLDFSGVRDHYRRHLATRGMSRLLVQVRCCPRGARLVCPLPLARLGQPATRTRARDRDLDRYRRCGASRRGAPSIGPALPWGIGVRVKG